jgi:hypothetical protein
MLDESTSEVKFYSFEEKRFKGHPSWRGGVVTAAPTEITQNGPVDFADILDTPEKSTALNTAGFRVETLPDPNKPLGKSLSKQYRHVPLRSIRPLSQWQLILRGIAENKLPPSIKNALTCATTVSLVEKFKAVGSWPAASLFCKGVFIGAELVVVGDVVRLVSQNSWKKCTDVLRVESIRLNLEDMKAEHMLDNRHSPLLCSKSNITLVGSAYTLDAGRSYKAVQATDTVSYSNPLTNLPLMADIVKVAFRPVGSATYGSWWPLHPEVQKYEVSHDQVLGKMYEAEAVRLWTGQRQRPGRDGYVSEKPSLDFDVSGIMSARKYATLTDERLPDPINPEFLWFWADTRVDALDVATFNGLEVGRYHDVRDNATLEGWRQVINVLNGRQMSFRDNFEFTSVFPTGTRGRKPGSRVVDGKVVYPGDIGYPDGSAEDETETKPKASSQMAGAAFVSTDDEEDDEEPQNHNADEINEDDTIEVVIDGDSENPEESLVGKFQGKPPAKRINKQPTKEEIMSQAMASIEDDFDEDDHSDDERWWDEPVPLARGGTEESEGGDYDPKKTSPKDRAQDSKSTVRIKRDLARKTMLRKPYGYSLSEHSDSDE